MKVISHTWVVICAGLFLGGRPLSLQAAITTENQVKAVFLFNFAQFVHWPAEAFSDANAPLVIGVLGDDPFGAYLDEVARGETVQGRPLLVRRYRREEEIKICHVLFIAPSESRRWQNIFAALSNRPILTVGNVEGFTRSGGMIRFITERNRVGLRINLRAAESAGLSISSKLLRGTGIDH